MAMDSSECNGSREAPKVELEGKASVEFGSEKDLAKSDCIASTEREVNDQDGVGGPFVIINGDSDNSSKKVHELDEKADPETTVETKVSPSPPINAGNEIGVKVVDEEAESKSRSDPAQGEPSLKNSELGEEIEEKGMEGTENGELSENREINFEFRDSAEKQELGEETVVAEISQEEGKDPVLPSSVNNKNSSEEATVEENGHEEGKKGVLSLAGKLEKEKDVNLGAYESETTNGEEIGSEVVSDSAKNVEEEHPISGSIESTDKEIERMQKSETIVGEPDQHEVSGISLSNEEQVPEEVEEEPSVAPSEQAMHEESEGLSDSLDTQKKAKMPVSESKDLTLGLAVTGSEQKHETKQVSVPSQEEEIQEESEGVSDSLQGNETVEMPETESREQLLLDSAVVVESELKHELQQEASSPSQEDEVHEESKVVSDFLQSNTESDAPGTELNSQFPLDSAVEVESEQKHEEQQESSPSQEDEVQEESEGVSDSFKSNKESDAPGAELNSQSPLDLAVEVESEQKHEEQQESSPSQEDERQEESEGVSDSFKSNKESDAPGTELNSQSPLDSAVEVESEQKHEEQQESSPSQEDEVHEESKGVSDSFKTNEESDAPAIELNSQSPLDSAVEVESEQKHEEQNESSLSQGEEVHEGKDEVPLPSEGKMEFMEAPETELKEMNPSDFEIESKEADETIAETKIHDQDIVTTVCYGKENGDSEASGSPILVEMEKHAPCSTSPDRENLEPEIKQESDMLEAKDEPETLVSDTGSQVEAPSESINGVEETQNCESGDAASVTPAIFASPGEAEVHFRSVNKNELLESSSEVLPESENKSSSEVEESDRSVTEVEDGPSKTEAETVSVSSSDTSARGIGLDDSVQIGKFKISIGENGPAILQEEMQEGVETARAATPEEPGTSTFNGEKPEVQPVKRQALYIIKVPRYSDEEQWEKIQEAQARLDELTRARDAIRDIMQKRRKACSDSWDEVVKAKEEERAARAVLNAKRHEISTVQSVINKLNKANSIDDMDDLIEMKEKTLQHETMTLKQEKMLIQEIKELKAQRKKLVDNMGSAAEIDEAFDQKDSVFDKLKTLKTELEVLVKTLTKAETKTKAVQKAYDEEDLSYCALQDEHKSADEVRQKAYLYWRDLKSELAKKNKHFFNYRDDQKRAANFLSINPPDKEGLHMHCNRQVEKMMELWNNDTEFRKQYIESNKISTLRRLRTLDGRSLGPDEVPPVIPSTSTAYRRTSTPLVPTTKEIRLERPARVSSSPSIQSDEFPELPHNKSKIYPNNSRNDKATSSKEKVMDQPVVMDKAAAIESARMEKNGDEDEMERSKREEMERARKEEDIRRKAKAEAEEKERLREEQKAKAKEAEERKKRKAEKAQERAEFKARKEAEMRDKKRSKKDKKKASGAESDNGDATNGAPTESIIPEIAQIRDMPAAAAPTISMRRPTRPQVALKQLKRVEPVPVALRNRGRRKMRSWIIGIVTAIAALLTVFFIGNYVNFSDSISSLVWL